MVFWEGFFFGRKYLLENGNTNVYLYGHKILTSGLYVWFNALNKLVPDLREFAFLTKNCILILF